MTLSKREESILTSIIDHYIQTGEPAGSKLLQSRLPFAVSSATIRNEMAYLSELGFLEQPHTSAGRVPTEQGYRYYVKNLLPRLSLSSGEMFRLLSGIDHAEGDAERLLQNACNVLYEVTGVTAAAAVPDSSGAKILAVQAVPVGSTSALVVVTTSCGMLKSRIAKLNSQMDYTLLTLFYNVTAANFVGITVGELTKASLQNVVSLLGEQALSVLPLLVCMYEAVRDTDEAGVITAGKSALLSVEKSLPNAFSALELLQNSEAANRLLKRGGTRESSILIGRETGFAAFEGISVITAPYMIGENEGGRIGLIGSMRMDYSHFLPIAEYTAQVTGRLIAQNCKSR